MLDEIQLNDTFPDFDAILHLYTCCLFWFDRAMLRPMLLVVAIARRIVQIRVKRAMTLSGRCCQQRVLGIVTDAVDTISVSLILGQLGLHISCLCLAVDVP